MNATHKNRIARIRPTGVGTGGFSVILSRDSEEDMAVKRFLPQLVCFKRKTRTRRDIHGAEREKRNRAIFTPTGIRPAYTHERETWYKTPEPLLTILMMDGRG